MKRIKLRLRKQTLAEKVQLGQTVVTAMTDNANFAAPNPPLATVSTLRNNISAKSNAIAALQASLRTEFAEKVALEAEYDTALAQLAAYVESVAGGDEAVIQSSGFAVAAARTPVGLPSAPQSLSAQTADLEGEVNTSWDAVLGAGSYVVECATTPGGPWNQLTITTRATYRASGLTSGTKYWFRVRAVGAAGAGPWSEPAVKMAA